MPITVTPASRPTPPRRAARPLLASERPARPAGDSYEATMARHDATLAAIRQRSARREAAEAKVAKLRNASQACGLLGFCTMIAAGAAGPALPFVMGAGMLLMAVVPAVLYGVGSKARKELAAIDREVGVY